MKAISGDLCSNQGESSASIRPRSITIIRKDWFCHSINTLKDKLAYLSQPPVYMGFNARDMDLKP